MGADLDAGASTSWNAHAYSFVCPGGRLRSGLNQYLITTDTQPLLAKRSCLTWKTVALNLLRTQRSGLT